MKDMLTAQELNILVEHCKIIGAISFVESSFHFPEEGDFSVLNSRSLFSLQENKYFRDFISQTAPKNKDRTIIASSLETPLSVRLALSENRGCIVGSALMEKDASLKIMDFLEQCKRENILIKVCGARTSQDLELALNYKVDFIGINLIPTSKRFIGKENLKKLLPYLESIQEKICFITRIDTCPQCLELISHLKCAEQTYFTPLLPNRIMLFSSPHMNFIGSTALVLDGENPGSGLPTNYPLNKNNVSTPVFISAGITAHNFLEKKYEALEKGWNVVGIDCSSSVCVKNLEENLNSFSGDKMFNFMKEQQNYFITPLLELKLCAQ